MLIDVKHFARNVQFVVSDTDPQYPPKTFEELKRRCDEIKREIPSKGDNKPFAEKLFTIFKDCGLITWENKNKAEFYNWVVNRALVNLGVPQNLQARKFLHNLYY